MEAVLEFGNGVNVPLLEQVMKAMSTSPDAEVRTKADQILTAYIKHPQSWTTTATVLEQSKDPATRYFALQVLEETIKYRWMQLPAEQREGIRNFVVKTIIDMTSTEAYTTDRSAKQFVSKMDLVLVQILKQAWPHNWPNFIPELVASSKTSEVLCENNVYILKLLSEEVFDFSKEEMTSEKVKKLKNQLNTDFRLIFELLQLILSESTRPSLVLMTLQTLLRFLAWIPLGYVFETPLVELLTTKFLPNTTFRNATLSCLTEVVSVREAKYDTVHQNIFSGLMTLLQVQLPPNTDIPREYETAGERETEFVRGLALFFSAFFLTHLDICERPQNHQNTVTAMFYLVSISMVDDKEVFAICLDVWSKFAKDLYEKERMASRGGFGGNSAGIQDAVGRKTLYQNVLTRVRSVMISKMAKPEEVLIVDNGDGSIVRETTKDTDAIAQYRTMRETLIYLTHLDYNDTEDIMLTKLGLHCNSGSNEFSWKGLNTLCWAVGSISGSMSEEDEKSFLVIIIKDLLGLCEQKRGKDNKAVVASNIMYVVGQYPRFLRAHWKFLRTVVNKLFEFMHERHPGVQDMACDTFLKISQKCRDQFVILHPSEKRPFVDDLISEMRSITNDLERHQRQTFYEAVGFMVREQPNEEVRNVLLSNLMSASTEQWRQIMQLGSQNSQSLTALETIKVLADILRTNVRVCSAMGYTFRPHLMGLYLDMLHVYKFYSNSISESVQASGEQVTQHMNVKSMGVVNVETLRLIETFVTKADSTTDIANNFVPPLCESVLDDYQAAVPQARKAEVLQLFTAIVNKLKAEANVAMNGGMVQRILAPVFVPTLEMITKNHVDFPDHRIAFYKLLKALNLYCFERLFDVPPETQKHIIDAVVWAIKHTERNISETGLDILERLLQNVSTAPDTFAQTFYQTYFLALLQDVLVVLTDRLHVSGFTWHCSILRHMFAQVQSGRVKVPLGPNVANNQQFLQQHVCQMIAEAFPNVGKKHVEDFVVGLFDPNKDLSVFKSHVRDFLIRLKEFSADESVVNQFYLQENEEAKRVEAEQKLRERAAIPGLLTQQEKDEMADL